MESTEPGVIVELLNQYIDGVAQVIFAHEGTVMKVIGNFGDDSFFDFTAYGDAVNIAALTCIDSAFSKSLEHCIK